MISHLFIWYHISFFLGLVLLLDRCLDLLIKFEKILKEKSLRDIEDEDEEGGSGRGSGRGSRRGRGGDSLKECRLDFAG